MKRVKLHDKEFELFISEEKIQDAIKELAAVIEADLKDEKPLFVGVLNGSFLFIADLIKHLDFECEVSFVKVTSYKGTGSTGEVSELIGLSDSIEGRTIVLVEDIIDSGLTIEKLMHQLQKDNPTAIKIASLLLKPEAYKKDIPVDYVAIEIPNDFIVGYGLDYNGLGRNLNDIYKIVE